MKKNIALMAGGNSSEYVVSVKSAAQIEKILDRTLYNPFRIEVKGQRWFYTAPDGSECDVDKNDFSITVSGEKIVLEYGLILIHGTPGEDGLLQGYFEITGVPYSTCNVAVSALTFDKYLCKRILDSSGIPMARDILITKGDTVDPAAIAARLGLPLFVKPNASGSSFGVSKVKSEAGIIPAVEAALKESDRVLVEEFMQGREVSCGIMVADEKPYIFPVTEIISKREFFDFEAKYTDGMSQEITPADIPEEVKERLNDAVLKIYRATGCRGVVRIDFMIVDGIPHMIEINTVPGMSENSIIPKQAAAMGMNMTELFNIIIGSTVG